MRIFILEDDSNRIRLFREAAFGLDAVLAESVPDAIKKYTHNFDVLFLDHDLGGMTYVNSAEKNTGSEFCRLLPECNNKLPVFIHSYNPVGADNMYNILEEKGYLPVKMPFGPKVLNLIKELTTRMVKHDNK